MMSWFKKDRTDEIISQLNSIVFALTKTVGALEEINKTLDKSKSIPEVRIKRKYTKRTK